MALGVGNDPHRKASRKNFRNSKTDSIDTDRTLGNYIMPGIFRQFDFQSGVCAFRVESYNRRDAINVALNEMSADATVSG